MIRMGDMRMDGSLETASESTSTMMPSSGGVGSIFFCRLNPENMSKAKNCEGMRLLPLFLLKRSGNGEFNLLSCWNLIGGKGERKEGDALAKG